MSDRDKQFDGCVVLITGATSGIGAECAREFARRGASLMLTGRDESRGAAILGEVENIGARASFLAGDIRNAAFCASLVDSACERFQQLDVLVNSAGVWRAGTAVETTDELWEHTLAVNLTGLFFVCRAALPVMVRQRRGSIVNIASDWGLVGGEAGAAYCASKGGVVLLTKAMALDHAKDNIRINAVCPTDTDTPMMEDDYHQQGISYAEGKKLSAAVIPTGRMAMPADVAAAVCFLASDQASFITGTALPLDGGVTAG
jgi:2,3-dihydro-2,3-dihydroxybenzoate dehydrogenase